MDNNAQQLDLFSNSGNTPQAAGNNRSSIFGHIRGYEKSILIVIGFIIVVVISFSLGVEKGKLLALKTPAIGLTVPQPAQVKGTQAIPAQVKLPAVKTIAPAQQIDKLQGYTIQIASFQKKSLAQEEAGALKKKGLQALVIPKGGYNILCIGSFNNKEAAQPLLSELRKKYPDSFIRRL